VAAQPGTLEALVAGATKECLDHLSAAAARLAAATSHSMRNDGGGDRHRLLIMKVLSVTQAISALAEEALRS
jgi:hypothetical protein